VSEQEKCPFCGGEHEGVCPKVAAIEYAEDGKTMNAVHFFPPPAPLTVQTPEPDASYRTRLKRAIAADSVNFTRVDTDAGSALDELGSFYDLPRGVMVAP